MDGNFYRTSPPPHYFMSFHRELNSSPSTEPLPILFCKLRFIRPGQRKKPQALAVYISCNPEITTLITFIPKVDIEIQISCYSFRGGSGGTHQLSTFASLLSPVPQRNGTTWWSNPFDMNKFIVKALGGSKIPLQLKTENIYMYVYIYIYCIHIYFTYIHIYCVHTHTYTYSV